MADGLSSIIDRWYRKRRFSHTAQPLFLRPRGAWYGRLFFWSCRTSLLSFQQRAITGVQGAWRLRATRKLWQPWPFRQTARSLRQHPGIRLFSYGTWTQAQRAASFNAIQNRCRVWLSHPIIFTWPWGPATKPCGYGPSRQVLCNASLETIWSRRCLWHSHPMALCWHRHHWTQLWSSGKTARVGNIGFPGL